MKEDIKKNSAEIKELKKTVKTKQKSNVCAARDQSDLHWLRMRTRHLFIAYGIVRGRTIDQIEVLGPDKCRSHNDKLVLQIIEAYSQKEEPTQ